MLEKLSGYSLFADIENPKKRNTFAMYNFSDVFNYDAELTRKRREKVEELKKEFCALFNQKYDNTSYYIENGELVARIGVSDKVLQESGCTKNLKKYLTFRKKIIDSIFFAIYGQENAWNYSLAVCINNYNNPLCKEEVIARLHNDNKASIKIFECLTGLKLPKGYKERKAYLESISVSNFKEAVDYKPRKKREKKERRKNFISMSVHQKGKDGQKLLQNHLQNMV